MEREEMCPIELTVDVIGNKWKPLIISVLLDGTQRFGEIKHHVHGISPKVLTDNLRALEADGLVARRIYAEVPLRVEYTLTALGKRLAPMINGMIKWGETYQQNVR